MEWRRWSHALRARLRAILRPGRTEADLDDELSFHLAMRTKANEERGFTRDVAERRAKAEFGGIESTKLRSRDMLPLRWLQSLHHDCRYALRYFAKNPSITTVALLSLAVGIGANTAIFSLADAVLWRPLPVSLPEQLVLLEARDKNGESSIVSYPMYRDLAARQRVFSDIIACRDYLASPLRVGNGGTIRAARGGAVSGNYFSALGLRAPLGRFLTPADDEPGRAAPVAVVSYDFWRRELGGASSAIGQSLTINETPFTVIGVAPEGFAGLSVDTALDVWVPLTAFRSDRELRNRQGTFFRLLGRLKSGTSVNEAQAAITVLFQQLRKEESGTAAPTEGIALQPGSRGLGFFRERVTRTLTTVMIFGGMIVAIVGMNLTTLLSARADARRREFAVRQALGGSRRRLLRQLLTENVLLALAGGALGLVFATWAGRVLLTFVATDIALHSGFSPHVPETLQFHLNLRVLAFTVSIAVLLGVVLALAPTRLMARPDLMTPLKLRSGNSGVARLGGIRTPVRKTLVVLQVALSVMLLVGAGLMVRTVFNLRSLNAGIHRSNVLLVDFDSTATGRPKAELILLQRTLHERLNALPGVQSASLSWLNLFSDSDLRMRVLDDGTGARMDVVSPGYFETVGMTVLSGRGFEHTDDGQAPRVVIVNEAFGRRFFPGGNPIGKRFAIRNIEPRVVREIVGVIRDAKYNNLKEDAMEMFFLPLSQTDAWGARSIQVRSTIASPQLAEQVRRLVAQVDRNIVITETKTLEEQIDRTLNQERLLAALSAFFGVTALCLACVGLYSVLAFQVAQRTQEIGVRMALGSTPANVVWLVTREAMLLVGVGLVLGVPFALAMTRLMASQLFGISATDAPTVGLVISVLGVAAGLSCYLPARRAASLSPIHALRPE